MDRGLSTGTLLAALGDEETPPERLLELAQGALLEARREAARRLHEQHGSYAAAAAASGIGRRTLLRWAGLK